MEQPSKEYWDEVRQHTAEILDGEFIEERSSLGLKMESRDYRWPGSEANQTVTLHELRFRLFGAIPIRRSVSMHIHEHEPEVSVYRMINYTPRWNSIDEVRHGMVDDDSADDEEEFKRWMAGRREARRHGLDRPTEEDYRLLLDHLRKGVEYRRFEHDH